MDSVQIAAAIIVGFVALGVLVAVWCARGARVARISRARVRGSATDVLDEVQLTVSGSWRTSVRRDSDRVLTVESRWTPWWAVIVALVAFPIGLLALVFTERENGTIIVDQLPDGVVLMRMGGSFRSDAVRAINRVIERRSLDTGAQSSTAVTSR